MPWAQDLLEQARFLSRREAGRGRPRQASLRRAVSTAYYAVFHLLSAEATSQACPANPAGLRERVQRALGHDTMKQAANAFQSNRLPANISPLLGHPVAAPLISVARGFVRLQEERHKADYDLSDQFDRLRVQGLLREAEQVFSDWNTVRNTDDAHLFLASLLFWKLWSKQ
jgi:hypothetical protein